MRDSQELAAWFEWRAAKTPESDAADSLPSQHFA